MKKLIITVCLLAACICMQAHGGGNFVHSEFAKERKAGEKAAIVMVHFGTTHADTRALTIDAINKQVQNRFPEWDFYEAYTSRIVMRRLKAKGMEKQNPSEVLQSLADKGYRYVIIQSTNIIDGIEMESLRKEIEAVRPRFKDIRLGTPLLYTPDDYAQTISAIVPNLPEADAVVFVGHGTYTPATACYAMLDYMLKAKGYGHCHVGTIEGYPAYDDMLQLLKRQQARKVLLVPFMFVAGDHAKNDIAGEWKENLEKEGYEVEIFMQGLGQNPGITELFLDHIRFISTHREVDILEKKARYAKEKDE